MAAHAEAISGATMALDALVRSQMEQPTDDLMSQIAVEHVDGRR